MGRNKLLLSPSKVHWTTASGRWALLVSLLILSGLNGVLTPVLVPVLAGWSLLALLASIGLGLDWWPAWATGVATALDVAFALLTVFVAGGVSGLLGWVLPAAGLLAALGGLATSLQLRAAKAHPPGVRASHIRRREWEQALANFRRVSMSSLSVDYPLVLQLARELRDGAIDGQAQGSGGTVIGLLVREQDQWAWMPGRNVLPADGQRLEGDGKTVIEQCVEWDEPVLFRQPSADPVLGKVEVLRKCPAVLCVPLREGLEAPAVLVLANPGEHAQSDERSQLLGEIGRRVAGELKSVRLHRDLEKEKERITEVQDEARKRMSRDLHDGPTQTIAAIAMRLNYARRLMRRDQVAAISEIAKVEELARSTAKELRHMLFTLRPLILESQGLVAALFQLAVKMHDTHGQLVIVEADDEVVRGLGIEQQSVLFFIAEEAITNARKHAEAEHIWVRLRTEDGRLVLEVQDDGVGFNVGEVDADYAQRGSLGMVSMRERAELVHGIFHLESQEGVGTRISVHVPLTSGNRQAKEVSGESK